MSTPTTEPINADPSAYCHRWHDEAANNVLSALDRLRDALFDELPHRPAFWRQVAADRVFNAESCSMAARANERVHGSVFPGVKP